MMFPFIKRQTHAETQAAVIETAILLAIRHEHCCKCKTPGKHWVAVTESDLALAFIMVAGSSGDN